MKTLILIITLFTNIFAHAQSNELLTSEQKKDILTSIDKLCGDTWCEGSYDLEFKDFTCDKSTNHCQLNFYFIMSTETKTGTYSSLLTCNFFNIKSFNQIKESKYSLNESFLEELTDCITTHEYSVVF